MSHVENLKDSERRNPLVLQFQLRQALWPGPRRGRRGDSAIAYIEGLGIQCRVISFSRFRIYLTSDSKSSGGLRAASWPECPGRRQVSRPSDSARARTAGKMEGEDNFRNDEIAAQRRSVGRRLLVLEDPQLASTRENPQSVDSNELGEMKTLKTDHAGAVDELQGFHSPKAYSRRTSALYRGQVSEFLARGRSASPVRHGSQEQRDVKGQLKSMVMSRSMPNLGTSSRSSYNRSIGLSVLSSLTESDQANGVQVAAVQAAHLEDLLRDI